MITNLAEDLTMNVINYFNIKMLRNFGLVDKSGMENIQKFLVYRKNINKKNKIKSTYKNSLIRLKIKYLRSKYNIKNTAITPSHHENYKELIVKIKKFKYDRFGSNLRPMIKCYLSIMGTTNGDQYFLYPWWCEVYSTEFDENDYIPYKS